VAETYAAFQQKRPKSVGVPAAASVGECEVFTPQRIWQLAVFGQVFNQYHILVLSNSEWERFCPILL